MGWNSYRNKQANAQKRGLHICGHIVYERGEHCRSVVKEQIVQDGAGIRDYSYGEKTELDPSVIPYT